jgi:predicted CoA-binding protein
MNDDITEFINKRVWAVVGVSQNTNKFGYKVFQSLSKAGYKVFPINPLISEIDGAKCYKTISELPEKVGVISLVVPPIVSEKIVEECIQTGIERIWFQPGSESLAAISKAKEAGLKVIHNECILLERKVWDS